MTHRFHMMTTGAQEPRLVVVLLHGLGQHAGLYRHVAAYWKERGIVSVIGDLPGHGRSPGFRGHIDQFSDYIEAARTFLACARERYPAPLPLVLCGHSMGGLVAALAAARLASEGDDTARPDGLILCSPCFQLALATPLYKVVAARILLPVVPHLRQPTGIRPEDLTHDPDIITAYHEDRLVVHHVTLRWFFELRAAMAGARAEAGRIQIPTALYQAGSDRVVNAAASRAWYEALASQQKVYREYPGRYHELLHEQDRDQILADITSWMEETFT